MTEMPSGSIRQYHREGNTIYFKNADGEEKWWEYSENGKLVHTKDSNGDKVRWEYDAHGRPFPRHGL